MMDEKEFMQNITELAVKSEDIRSFIQQNQNSFKSNNLDTKTKELIALGCAIVSRCEYCIRAHLRNLIENGVTEGEIIDTLNVATTMAGGPGLAYSTLTYKLYKEMKK
ncbi:MAG: carboxymuconolactone decarboxylase family protein [Deferribacterota bacterium]|nr:carboxymuconolactone decarboxylase family protein [Deferribacterota bacterium]